MLNKMHVTYSIVISTALLFIMFTLKMKHKTNFNSINSIECGFNSMNSPKFKFSNQFFMISILFVIFDMELIAILPIPLSQKILPNLMLMISILIVLAFSILMEWINGLIEWTMS